MKPKLSVLFPAMLGYERALPGLQSWESQTHRDRLEILILCPDGLGPTAAQASALPPGQVIVPVGAADLHEARAMGIQKASGDFVMLAEDHCLPDPEWSQAILDRIDEGWDGVGPVLRPGNQGSCWPEGSFLIGYGEWMIPAVGGPTQILCGWNGTIRTSLLKKLGSELAGELLLGAFLVRRLREEGHRFYLEDRARMRHFDPFGFVYELWLLLIVGLGFGAMRTRKWTPAARLLYPLAAPAVAFLHWKRAFVHYRRAGTGCGLRPAALVAALLLASAWGLGEAIGAWMGVGRVAPFLWRTEVKPVSQEDLARSDSREQAGAPESPGARVHTAAK